MSVVAIDGFLVDRNYDPFRSGFKLQCLTASVLHRFDIGAVDQRPGSGRRSVSALPIMIRAPRKYFTVIPQQKIMHTASGHLNIFMGGELEQAI